MKIEYTEEKNKSIMETLLTTALDVEEMMAVGYALAKQAKKEPELSRNPVLTWNRCPICGHRIFEEFANYCDECGQRIR